MAFGILKADTLTHSTAGSLTTDYVVNGSAKAWVNFNGDNTSVIRDSHNASSITDSGTGDQAVNYTNSFSNTGYSPQSNCQSGDSANPASCVMYSQGQVLTGSTKLYVTQDGGTTWDSEHMSLTSCGDLA